MSEVLTCPHCRMDMLMEAAPGDAVRCRYCGDEFVVGAAAAAAPRAAKPWDPTPAAAVPDDAPLSRPRKWPWADEWDRPDRSGGDWAGFRRGAGAVTVGMSIELAALVGAVLLVLLDFVAPGALGRPAQGLRVVLGLIGLGFMVGAVVVAVGRTMQAGGAPGSARVGGPLGVGAALSWLHAAGLLFGPALLALALTDRGAEDLARAGVVLLVVGLMSRSVADFSGAITLGVVGGRLQSEAILRRVTGTTVGLQLLGLAYAGVIAVLAYAAEDNPLRRRQFAEGPVVLVVALLLAILVVNGVLNLSLNAAGRRAGADRESDRSPWRR